MWDPNYKCTDTWMKSWCEGKEGLLTGIDYWDWHKEWFVAAQTNPGVISVAFEDFEGYMYICIYVYMYINK